MALSQSLDIDQRDKARAEPRRFHTYHAYGLAIRSDIELPELEPGRATRPDLTIRRANLDRRLSDVMGDGVFEFGPTDAYLAWGGVGHFRIRSPELIELEPHPDIDPALMNFALLGAVMATLLHMRGMLVLHASAVDIGGRAAIFLGDKGAGKSTTAAALVKAGHRLLTDDVLAIDFSGRKGPRLIAGYPQVKLSTAASCAIQLEDATTIPIANIGFEKSRLRLGTGFSSDAAIPAACYVLDRSEELAAVPLSSVEGMMALMRYSYPTRFGDLLIHGDAASVHMSQCAQLASVTPTRRLMVPAALDRLSEVAELVERDLPGAAIAR
jgi:hypothetical protein